MMMRFYDHWFARWLWRESVSAPEHFKTVFVMLGHPTTGIGARTDFSARAQEWLDENCPGRWRVCYERRRVYFKKAVDAVHYKLVADTLT